MKRVWKESQLAASRYAGQVASKEGLDESDCNVS